MISVFASCNAICGLSPLAYPNTHWGLGTGWVYGLGSIGTLERKMDPTIVYWGYTGIMERTMETTIMGYIGFRF